MSLRGRIARRCARALPAWLALAGSVAAQTTNLVVEGGVGHEEISSPLIRIAPNAPLIQIAGLNRLSGMYYRTVGSGMRDWQFGAAGSLAVSARGEWKRAPSSPDLDFGMLSGDLMWRRPLDGLVVGVGPTVQRMWVAGDRFRDATGVQMDLTRPTEGGGYWAGFAAVARNRHAEAYRDFDSHAASLTVHRRLAQPFGGFSALDLEAGAAREVNRRNADDLSSRSAFVRASIDRRMLGMDWSFGVVAQAARFDAPFLDGFPARRDRYRAREFSLSRSFGEHLRLRLEHYAADNVANVAAFDNRYRMTSITLSMQY